jgi:predicted ATP-grasp superfamily ATP-dependent carboligase
MTRQARRLIIGIAGSSNSFGTIQSVRDHFGHSVFVVATDSNPRELVAASVLADAFVQVPLALAPEFPAALRDIAAVYPDSHYLPIHDHELEVSTRLAADGRWPAGLKLIAPSYDVVRLCSDKWLMHQWLRAHGLPSPETTLATPDALATMRRPAILKPREGYAARGVRLVHETKELAGLDPDRWLLQDRLQDPVVAIDVFLSRHTGTFRCTCREGIEERATVVMKVRVFDDPVLADIAERLARGLPLFGAFLFQVMRDAAGRWAITDVNPRVGSATRMMAALGLDFAAANLADYWHENTDTMLPPLSGEHFVVRQYASYVTRRDPRSETRQ